MDAGLEADGAVLPPSSCAFSDRAVLVIDDTPGCSYVTIAPADGIVLTGTEHGLGAPFASLRASVRVFHRGTRRMRAFHRRSAPGPSSDAYTYTWRDELCDSPHGTTGHSRHWLRWQSVIGLPSGSDSHLLFGSTEPGTRIDVAACVDADPTTDDTAPSSSM